MTSDRLDGATVLVIGGSNETGPYVAQEFARCGAELLLTYFSDKDGAEKTADQVCSEGRKASIHPLDLLDSDSIENFN